MHMTGKMHSKCNCTIFNSIFLFHSISGRPNGITTQKIRSHHETLARENEKLARQLYQRDRQQGQSNGKRVIVVQDDHPIQRVNFVQIDR